jgi:DNA-binding transcriptional MerR regulator
MKKTIERINKQHSALVDVIQWLDSNGHSNKPIREIVDKVLNGSNWESLEDSSNTELELSQIKSMRPMIRELISNG